jgi:hypothetical protein
MMPVIDSRETRKQNISDDFILVLKINVFILSLLKLRESPFVSF